MRKFVKRGFTVLPAAALLLSVAATSFSSALHAEDQKLPKDAEQIVSREMYQRGALTRFEIPETSKYGMNKVRIVEFDPAQSDQKVVNSVILSHGADRNAPSEETAKPEPSASTPAEAPQQPKKGSSALWKGILIGGSVLCFIIAVLLAVRSGNKKYGK